MNTDDITLVINVGILITIGIGVALISIGISAIFDAVHERRVSNNRKK